MLLHHVDSNSFWVEPLKNQTEGLLIAARMQALEKNAKAGKSTKVPNRGQPMLHPYEISHGIHNTVGQIVVKDDVQTCTTGGPSKELSQEVN